MISVGQVDSSDILGTTLHYSAYHGNKRALKKVLDKGIHVDYPNDEGQTPLFCACLAEREGVVDHLLSYGADPNEKSNIGLTPLHAACYAGSIKILMKLLHAGGDLRLHDHQGRSVKEWAMLNAVPKKRMKILEFLDKTRMFAMSNSGQDLLMKKASSRTIHRAHLRSNIVTQIIREVIGKPSINDNLEKIINSQQSLGFGQVYCNGMDNAGFMSVIPLVCENSLKHNPNGETFNNGAFCVMESMWWDYSIVTVKRLHKDIDPYQGGVVDLLINEIEHIGRLRHPNILTLMGVCQTNNLDGLLLVYESVAQGSLFTLLHHKMEVLSSKTIQDVALQLCGAIIFIHLRGLVHCAITSHAIFIVNMNCFKLGNFEYMTEISKCEWGKKNAVATNMCENALYNWMAPEVMFNMPPSFYCDMYSYCSVLWEMFHGEVPWNSQGAETIKSHIQKGNGIKILNGKIAEYYKIILDYGLQQDPNNRKLSFLHVRNIMEAAPKDIEGYLKTHFQHLHNNSDKGGGISRPGQDTGSPTKFPGHSDVREKTNKRSVDQTGEHFGRKEKDKQISQSLRSAYQSRKIAERDWEKPKFSKDRSSRQEDCVDESDGSGRWDEGNISEFFVAKSRQVKGANWNNNSRSFPTLTTGWKTMKENAEPYQQIPQKPARQLQYNADGLSCENYPKQDYVYTVQVKMEPSPERQTHLSAASRDLPMKALNEGDAEEIKTKEPNNALNNPVMKNSETDVSQNELMLQYAARYSPKYTRKRDLDRKTSSMGNFSYLKLEKKHEGMHSSGAKPAIFGQCCPVVEEYSTLGKLSTAGSLYALYNEHSPDLPLGQLEQRCDNFYYSTSPKRKTPSAPPVEPDPNWFGGRGSVKNLAQAYQQQIQQHGFCQAVLEGTFNKNHSNEHLKSSTEKRIFPFADNVSKDDSDSSVYGHHTSEQKDNDKLDSAKSVSLISLADEGEYTYNLESRDVDDEHSDKITNCAQLKRVGSDFTIGSSTESDLVTEWVDHELRKIKRNLSREIMSKHKSNRGVSPHSFDANQKLLSKSQNTWHCYNTNQFDKFSTDNYEGSLDANSKQVQQTPEEEQFYFDDELYAVDGAASSENFNRYPAINWKQQQTKTPNKLACLSGSPKSSNQIRPDWSQDNSQESEEDPIAPELTLKHKSNLPMKTILKKTKPYCSDGIQESKPKKSSCSKQRIGKIPTSHSNLGTKKKISTGGAYANVVTIRSSLDGDGLHKVIHEMKNLKTGGSHAIFNESINAKKIVTKFHV